LNNFNVLATVIVKELAEEYGNAPGEIRVTDNFI
jgi:hypothetical protein